jgi:NTE family protein
MRKAMRAAFGFGGALAAALALAAGPPQVPPTGSDAAETPAQARTEAEATNDGARPCVGLVLGGGGARGAAHIGVLKVLERERVPVCAIAGTSMGAVVGALYASGLTPAEIEKALASVDWKDLFQDEPGRAGLPMRRKEAQLNYRAELEAGWRDGAPVLASGAVQGQKLGLLLRRLMLDASRTSRFDELPIPFRAVATDIVSGERVVFAEGDLAMAVRASMAVPAVFAPAEIDGRILVDGGIVDNVPVDVVREMGADVVIAVDVGSPLLTREEMRTPVDVAYQMISVLIQEKTNRSIASLEPGDVLIVPPLGTFSSAAFEQSTTVIGKGVEAAEAEAPRFRHLALPDADYADWRRERRIAALDPPPVIAFVNVAPGRARTTRLVEYRAQGLVGQPLDPDLVEATVAGTYAEGAYQGIGWRAVEREGQTGIELLPVDKAWGPVFFNVGLQIADDFNGRSDYQLTAELLKTGVSGDGDELRALLRLGQVTELSADWFAPLDLDRRFYVGLDAGYRAFDVPFVVGGTQAAEYRIGRGTLGLRLGLQTDPRWALEATLRRSRFDGREVVGTIGVDDLSQQTTSLGGRAVWDTLDRLSFPSRGSRAVLSVDRYDDLLGGTGNGWVARWRSDIVLSKDKHHLLLGTRWAATRDAPPELAAFSTLGGFLNLSGALERGLVGEELGYARAVYYYRFGDANALFAVPTWLGASVEAGQVGERGLGLDWDEATRAGGVFVGMSSPFGPILFGYGRTNRGDDTWTLSFGNLIRNED